MSIFRGKKINDMFRLAQWRISKEQLLINEVSFYDQQMQLTFTQEQIKNVAHLN